jgi:hypothetical protein
MIKSVTELRNMLPPSGVFALPTSGQITASEINVELGRAFNAEFHMSGAEERALAGIPTGEIKMSDFYGKSSVVEYIFTCGFLGLSWGYSSSGGEFQPRDINLGALGISSIYTFVTISPTRTILSMQATTVEMEAYNMLVDIETSSGSGVFTQYLYVFEQYDSGADSRIWVISSQAINDHFIAIVDTPVSVIITPVLA